MHCSGARAKTGVLGVSSFITARSFGLWRIAVKDFNVQYPTPNVQVEMTCGQSGGRRQATSSDLPVAGWEAMRREAWSQWRGEGETWDQRLEP